MLAAERLFAERGIVAVSNRQVSEAAGQGNNAAVGYHFGTKTDLLRAIVRKHAIAIEALRQEYVERTGDSEELRDWVACLIRPFSEHLDSLPRPTWFARFGAELTADTVHRHISDEESMDGPALQRILARIDATVRPELPLEVKLERNEMTRVLMSYTFAERERRLAEGALTLRDDWAAAGTGVIDALVGMWLAPVSR
jgi:AcrR family transcriptional regulator